MTKPMTGDEYLALISKKITDGINCKTGISKTPYFEEANKLLNDYCKTRPEAERRARALTDSLAQALRLYRDKDEIDQYALYGSNEAIKRHLKDYSWVVANKAAKFAHESDRDCQELAGSDRSYS